MGELERTLSTVSTQQKQADRVRQVDSLAISSFLVDSEPEGLCCMAGCLTAYTTPILAAFVVWLVKATWGMGTLLGNWGLYTSTECST